MNELFITSLEAVKRAPNDRRAFFIACAIQNTLHKYLYIFLNGEGLKSTSKALYPILDRLDPRDFSGLSECISEFQSWGVLSTDYANVDWCNISVRQLADIICHLYSSFRSLVPKIEWGVKDSKTVECGLSYSDCNYVHPEFMPVRRLKEYLETLDGEGVRSVIVHGSMATRDISIGSSDLDTLVILNDDAFSDPELLLRLRKQFFGATRYLYQADLLQHHGHFVLTDADLQFFPQSYFPLILFGYCMPIRGEANFLVRERDSTLDRIRDFLNTYQYLASVAEEPNEVSDKFKFKYLNQILLLAPCVLLQVDGVYCYKRDSFSACRKYFPAQLWNIVEDASAERTHARWSHWQFKLKNIIFPFNPRAAWIINRLIDREVPVLPHDYLSRIAEFAKFALEIKKEVINKDAADAIGSY